jgi:prepilin signal peptidase PulO-like enzyme (type II secretory pathway)
MLFFLFVVGAAVGSFVNVIALRYNTGLSFLKGSSVCLSCARPLFWYELIPLVSYIYLKGRCSGCYSRFSLQYFLVELISGLTVALLYLKFGLSLNLLLLSIIYYLLSIIFIYDLRHKIIPDSFVLVFIFLSFLYSYLIPHTSLLSIFLPAILIPLPFFLIWLLSKGRLMGLGDAKLMVGIGLLLGLSIGISAVMLSFWLGAAYVLFMYVYKKFFKSNLHITMKSELPFAPFLILGTVLAFVFEINLLFF